MRTTSASILNSCIIKILTTGYLLACLSVAPAQASEPIRVFVSVLPQKHFVEQIGGERVQVEALVQPGFSPETYEPTAQQVSRLAKAHLFIRIGMPFEDAWMKRVQAVNPNMSVLDARDGLTLQKMQAHEHEHEHEHDDHKEHAKAGANPPDGHTELDPHIWTSPRMVRQMMPPLRDKLIELLPDDAAKISANHDSATSELDALDKELTDLFAQHPNKKFMVFHPAWGYLAEAYHLTQIPIEFEGKEPGAKALTTLIKHAKTEGVKTIFVQPQFDQRAAKQVAKAINGKVLSIDPLAEDYVPNLRKTARLIAGVDDE